MKALLQCPWCESAIGFPARLGARPSSRPAKWYQFSRSIAVCPYCSKPVKANARSRAWILLTAPLLFLCVAQVWVLPFYSVPTIAFWALALVGLAGIVLSLWTMRLERECDP
ncbi:MAG TPA: hypothetical protein VFG73_10350 [Rhodanobacteraceae bacterium]|nr:hypothetical protein [Rhodanobacteraceae bacterium]